MLTIVTTLYLFSMCLISGCTDTSQHNNIRNTEDIMTLSHGLEAKSLIEAHHMVSGTIEFQRDSTTYLKYITGPQLAHHINTVGSSDVFILAKSVKIEEVHVVEYSSSILKAIGCGTVDVDLITEDGSLLQDVSPTLIMNIYVFVIEDNTWKLFTTQSFRDPQYDRHTLEYSNIATKNAIGDLQGYIDRYFPCGLVS